MIATLYVFSTFLVWYSLGILGGYMGCRYFAGKEFDPDRDVWFILLIALVGPINFIPALIWWVCEQLEGQ